jgi:adenylosuccinate lyase
MDFQNYQSPFSWRYASARMRAIWGEHNKRLLWRKIWVALAETQAQFGLVTEEQVADLRAQAENIDLDRALEIEAEIHHDLMAEIKTYAEQCPTGGGIIHLGATSMDIEDNADALRLRHSLVLVLNQLSELQLELLKKIEEYAGLPTMAHTHIQPAEPTTVGYRLATYAQDLDEDWNQLNRLFDDLKGKGFKGAAGTSASYADLIGPENLRSFEAAMSEKLELPFYPITTQTYPRKQEYFLLTALAGLGASIHKFAFDLRILQSPPFGEWSEPFGKKQVGSSAMPFKRNPINAEKLDSLCRYLAQLPRVAWDNAANSLLERTLDDSANRRTLLPEAFLIIDELLHVTKKVLSGIVINQNAIQRNLEIYGPFSATERVLMALVKKGAHRQEMHEKIREHTMGAWDAVKAGQMNPLHDAIISDSEFLSFLSSEELTDAMDASTYTGNAKDKALGILEIKPKLEHWLDDHSTQSD